MGANFNEKDNSNVENTEEDCKELKIVNEPDILSYSPGDKIKYDGISLYFDGEDVTDKAAFSIKQGSVWDKDFGDSLDVNITYDLDDVEYTTTLTLKKKRNKALIVIVILLVVLALIGGVFVYNTIRDNQSSNDIEAGSFILPQGDMSDEEAKEMLNRQVEESRITVSVSPKMRLRDNGDLRVNFIVAEQNNGLSERLEIEQDGVIVYKSKAVEPGYMIEWGSQTSAKEGPATATVYAVNPETGGDSGNPVSVEIDVVKDDE